MVRTAAHSRAGGGSDLDNYDLGELQEGFGSSEHSRVQKDGSVKEKKQYHGDLGLEGEVSVGKRSREPQIKLDVQRLLSGQGIRRLRSRARGLRFKGKGHEYSDAERLLTFYQLWLDDIFPKAKFLDSLSMVEKVGHKFAMLGHRKDWISESWRNEHGTGDATMRGTVHAHGETGTEQQSFDADLGNRHPTRGRGRHTGAQVDALRVAHCLNVQKIEGSVAVPGRAGLSTPNLEQEDDLDALIKEFDSETLDVAKSGEGLRAVQNRNSEALQNLESYADEEAAMAEMGGLWQ